MSAGTREHDDQHMAGHGAADVSEGDLRHSSRSGRRGDRRARTDRDGVDDWPDADTSRPYFRPWPPFFALIALIVLPFMVARDLGSDLLDAMLLQADRLEPLIGQWGIEFLGRALGDTMRLGFLLTIAGVLLYGILQLIALRTDRAWALAHPETRPYGWVQVAYAISGRQPGAGRGRYLSDCAAWGGDALLAPLRLGSTVFPMLGFLGTIVGLSGAIADLPSAVRNTDGLGPVLSDLYVAFDTTVLGLVGAILCLVLTRLAEGRIDTLRRLVTP